MVGTGRAAPRGGVPARLAWAVATVAALAGGGTGWLMRGAPARAETAAPAPPPAAAPDAALDALKRQFARPKAVPFPADNPYTPAKAELGRRLFFDPALSGGRTLACAGCHDPAKGWSDGLRTGRGERGQVLRRRTMPLWNLAWAPALMWDGRANGLEHQALMPIDNPDEMDRRPDDLAAALEADAAYRAAFAAAFPGLRQVTARHVAQALATYVRTLVSPATPFDRWLAGDAAAMSDSARRGFALFAGKARCAACHQGWAFTDHAFHDTGLPGEDRSRGAVLNLPAAYRAFKTPSLRDAGNRAPYMHDGATATLADAIAHYAGGIVARPTLSRDLQRIVLSVQERADLLAFLETLTVPGPADPAPRVAAIAAAPRRPPPVETRIAAQRDRQFLPGALRVRAGATVLVRNDDTTTHNVRIHDPALMIDSGAQEPGETVRLRFARPGTYTVFCGIHPTMKMSVEVTR